MDHVFNEYLNIKSQQFKLIAFYETAKFKDQAYQDNDKLEDLKVSASLFL